ncbi:hypothetical protein OROMI_004077 [Orobanche minor]
MTDLIFLSRLRASSVLIFCFSFFFFEIGRTAAVVAAFGFLVVGLWASSDRLGALGTGGVRALKQPGLGDPWSTWSSGDLCDGEQRPIQVSSKALSCGRECLDGGKFKFHVASRACTEEVFFSLEDENNFVFGVCNHLSKVFGALFYSLLLDLKRQREIECTSSKISGDSSMSDDFMTRGVDVDQDDLSVSDVSVVNCHDREVTRKGKKYVFIGEPAEPIGCPTGVLSPSPPSSLGEGALSAIKVLYSLPKSVRLSHKRERADWRIDKCICFYEIAFEIGLRLPLIPFIMESLGETKGINISVGTLRRTYYPKQHDSEMGLRDRVPSTDPLGESSVENIHKVPWLERKIKELLRAEVLPRTSIWLTAIEKLGGSTSSFIEAFMEGSKKHKIFTAKEMYAMARKKTKKRAPKVLWGEPEGDVSEIVMGEKAHLYLGSSAFNGTLARCHWTMEFVRWGCPKLLLMRFLILSNALT